MLRFALAAAFGVFAAQQSAPVQKAMHAVEWEDPAGDVGEISTNKGMVPGFDVVTLALVSDGTALTISATLAKPWSDTFASDVVEIYLDVDGDPTGGYSTRWSKVPGFELRARLHACAEYTNGASACTGRAGTEVESRYAVAALGTIIDTSGNTKDTVGQMDARPFPIAGALVSASLTYADLGVKPGQSIRLMARESSGARDATADFPVVMLTLK
jgi:hypothetical protein